MIGTVYIGLDFGMALTKVAAWVKHPTQDHPIRVAVEFPRDNDPMDPRDGSRALHLPSALWIGAGRIHGIPLAGTRAMDRVDGVKQLLLRYWGCGQPLDRACTHALGTAGGWNAEKLAILKLAFVYRYVEDRIGNWLAREFPGTTWKTYVNAAIPPEEGEFRPNSPRTGRMRSVLERALVLAKRMPARRTAEDATCMSIGEALASIDALIHLPLLDLEQTPVEVIPEALAAACFRITSDDARPGHWLTVDVGALTTDLSYFFFNPLPQFQIACYHVLQSWEVGTESLVDQRRFVSVGGQQLLPHEALARAGTGAAHNPALEAVKLGISEAMRSTLTSAIRHQEERIAAVFPNQRPCFEVLLVGGGSDHAVISPFIQSWEFKGIGLTEPARSETATLPRDVGVLTAEGQHRSGGIPVRDHAILTIALGLAQPRIELPRWTLAHPQPRWIPKQVPPNPNLGHN